MALNAKTSVAARNRSLDAALDVLNNGFLDLYDGAQPTDPDTAVTTQNKLARLPLSATAFAAASAGSKATNAITSASALASGTATWFRFVTSGGTAVHDGSIGASGANINMNAVGIVAGATVSCSGYTATEVA